MLNNEAYAYFLVEGQNYHWVWLSCRHLQGLVFTCEYLIFNGKAKGHLVIAEILSYIYI